MPELTIQERVDKATQPVLRAIGREDPIDVIRLAGELVEASRSLSSKAATLRRAAARTLHAEGWTIREIAREAELTSARISQILGD